MPIVALPQDDGDRFDLRRFVYAQKTVYASALDELAGGQKLTHWMWFVFPQADGLARSGMARQFAIKSRGEAAAYLAHPILGPRLLECTKAVLGHPHLSAHDIFGSPDDAKFRSCLTLFELADGGLTFSKALDAFFDGRRDSATLSIFSGWKK